jgi:stress-induced morphogen
MPNSPFAKIAEEDGLDFNADKAIKKAELSAAQKENDVFDEHHVGRRWAEKLALMTTHTGAFHELHGVKTPYGGVDEDGVDPWIPESQIAAAKEEAKMKLRVASRKFMGERLAEEHKKINDELLAKIGRPKVPRNREKGSPSSVTEAQLGMIGM